MENLSYMDAEWEGIVLNAEFHAQVARIVDLIPEGRIMIMVQKLQHGDVLHSAIPSSYWIRGEDDMQTREYVLKQLRHSDEKKVVAIVSSIGYLGINVYIHHLINVTGGKSPLQLIQKFGRGLRKAIDKDILCYHDFMFIGNPYLERHSRARARVLRKEGHLRFFE